MSKRSTTLIIILTLALAGLIVGFIGGGMWVVPVPAPAIDHSVSSAPLEGWCCTPASDACGQYTAGPMACLKGGGEAFNVDQTQCSQDCAFIHTHK